MFSAKQLERYAEVLLWGLKTARLARRRRFKKGDVVLIRYHLPASALAEILYRRLLEMGMHPVQRTLPTAGMEQSFFSLANEKQLVFQLPGKTELYKRLNGHIVINAPESLTHLKGVDPGKIGKFAVAAKAPRDILKRREDQGEFSWTLCIFPTAQLAARAGLTLEDYTRQVVKACMLNRVAPVDHWRKIFNKARVIKNRLNALDIRRLHIESATTDLEVNPGARRRWIGISGRNIPSFEIFLSPDWRGTRGVYGADQPCFRSGNRVEGVRLEFSKGRVIDISATAGQSFAKKQLAMDAGACRVGEFSLTDKTFSKIDRFMANTLFDENYGGKFGNCHIALGSSYSNTFDGDPQKLTPAEKKKLGFNDSALHWDLVNTEKKRVVAHLAGGGRKTIYENGRFAGS